MLVGSRSESIVQSLYTHFVCGFATVEDEQYCGEVVVQMCCEVLVGTSRQTYSKAICPAGPALHAGRPLGFQRFPRLKKRALHLNNGKYIFSSV